MFQQHYLNELQLMIFISVLDHIFINPYYDVKYILFNEYLLRIGKQHYEV